MDFVKSIILFFKRIFNKQESIKLIEAPVKKESKNNFRESLKVDRVKKNKKTKVETRICVGDGLGIQTKITF